MPEVWQPIEGYEGFYEVSDHGRVRSLPNPRDLKTRILKPNSAKYKQVVLCVGNKRQSFSIHRLVAAHFVPGDKSLTVNHKDGDKDNNCASNLEWMTMSEQQKHAIDTGLRSKAWGTGAKAFKIPQTEWDKIAELCKTLTQAEVAKIYQCSQSVISNTLKRRALTA